MIPELAHGVGRVYESPIPVAYYLVGAALTVIASFFVRALARTDRSHPSRSLGGTRGAAILLGTIRGYLLTVLGLVIIFAVIYSDQNGYAIPALTFWICLIIIPIVLCSLFAGIWPAASPWGTIESLYRDGSGDEDDEDTANPAPWWIAPLLIYGLFWFELISGRGFDALSILALVLGYSLYVLAFRRSTRWPNDQADPLGILFGFAQRIAPLQVSDGGIVFRGSVAGLDDDRPMPLGLFLSIFILLASTTLDNIRETVQWFDFQKAAGLDSLDARLLDSVALLALTLPFLVPFALCMLLAHRWAPEQTDLGRTARMFGWSLIPIGIAYVLAHNLPLVVIGLPQLLQQIAEGLGTDILHDYSPSPLLVWVIEIALIVGGHIIGVMAAHRTAVRVAGSHAGAFKSHVALTLLMSLFTITTLWLLSLPIVTS